jgi:hypothetical protein
MIGTRSFRNVDWFLRPYNDGYVAPATAIQTRAHISGCVQNRRLIFRNAGLFYNA